MAYHYILFDWDGTLVDSMPLVLAGHNVVRAHFGLEAWTVEDALTKATKSARENFAALYEDRADEADKIFYEYVNRHRFQEIKPMAYTPECLKAFKANGVVMGVVSNKKHEYLNVEIPHFKWDQYFDVIVGAGEAARDKPAADPIHLALSRLHPVPKKPQVLYVGDTEVDLLAAQNAGVDCAYVHHGKPDIRLTEGSKSVWSRESLAERPAWVKNNP